MSKRKKETSISKTKVEKQKKDEKKSKIIKKLIIILLIILIITLVTVYCLIEHKKIVEEENINKIKKQNDLAFIDYKNDVEFMTTWSYKELKNNIVNEKNLYKNTKIEIYIDKKKINNDSEIKFENVGNMDIDIYLKRNYKYKLIKQYDKDIISHKKISLNIKDTIFPILNGVNNKTITVGDNLNLLEGITATDEKEGNINVQVEGEVDTSKVGTYKVKIYAIDKNGNKTEQEMQVDVKDKPKVSSKNNYGTSSNNTSSSSSQNDASTVNGRLAIARSEARKVANQIFKSGMSDLQKAEAIAQYLYTNVDRQLNQSNEAYKTNFGNEAYAAFVLKIAACSGFCKAAMMLCEQGGLQCKHINANQWTHQWLEVYLDGRWVQMDPQLGAVFY